MSEAYFSSSIEEGLDCVIPEKLRLDGKKDCQVFGQIRLTHCFTFETSGVATS